MLSGSIVGRQLTAKQAALQAGLSLPSVVELIKAEVVFAVFADHKWWVSVDCVPVLRRIAEDRARAKQAQK